MSEDKLENIVEETLEEYEAKPEPQDAEEDTKEEKEISPVKELLKDMIIAAAIAFLIIQFIRPTIVKESSMEATLYENDYLFLSRQAYTLFGEPERGDIIVFKSNLVNENGKTKLLIKRIIGLPGDHIVISDNQVYINDELIDEPYIRQQGFVPGEVDQVLGEGELFCMGDNRAVSRDSRDPSVGTVDVDDVVGKAVFRLFPLSYAGKL